MTNPSSQAEGAFVALVPACGVGAVFESLMARPR
jgi:hypothetical protein